tara:strand:- start:5703 stop:5837 length:135 start_codon:yes stop_codon:yes gene_type:complete
MTTYKVSFFITTDLHPDKWVLPAIEQVRHVSEELTDYEVQEVTK